MDNRAYYSAFARPREELFLLQRVCYLLCTSLALTAGTAYLSRDVSPALGLDLQEAKAAQFACRPSTIPHE